MNEHKKEVFKIIELKNKNLVSCSRDSYIIFYSKNKSKYKKDYKYFADDKIGSLIQTKDNEICYSSIYYGIIIVYRIYFYDFLSKKNQFNII